MTEVPPPPPPPPLPPPPPDGGSDAEGQARAAAVKAARARRASRTAFKRSLVVWVFLSVLCIIIWLFSGGGYFWPAWVLFGLGVSAFWMALSAYGPRDREPNDQEIEAEMRRQQH